MVGKLVHPRKVVQIMQNFMNEVIWSDDSLLIEDEIAVDKNGQEMSLWDAYLIEEDGGTVDYKTIYYPIECVVKKGYRFCSYPEEDKVTITYDFKEINRVEFKQVYKNMIQRFPSGRGFAAITFVLLHELGHRATMFDVPDDYDRQSALKEMHDNYPKEEWNAIYYPALPDEKMATDWAIEWLKDFEHRKMAKAFEKKFFACFAK